jgi:hypothetical protein
MTETRTMPPLGGGSVDLDALHAADAKGADLAAAIEQARVAVPAAPPAPPPAPPAKPGKAALPSGAAG